MKNNPTSRLISRQWSQRILLASLLSLSGYLQAGTLDTVQLTTVSVEGAVVSAKVAPVSTECPNGVTMTMSSANPAAESVLSTLLVAKSTGRAVSITYTLDPVLPVCLVNGATVH